MKLSKQQAEPYKGPAHPGSISAFELNQILEEGIRQIKIVDVRPIKEHKAMRLAGSILIPLTEIAERSAELRDAQAGNCDSMIVVYCRSGVSSGKACTILRDYGFSEVRNLTGGILAWYREFAEKMIESDLHFEMQETL